MITWSQAVSIAVVCQNLRHLPASQHARSCLKTKRGFCLKISVEIAQLYWEDPKCIKEYHTWEKKKQTNTANLSHLPNENLNEVLPILSATNLLQGWLQTLTPPLNQRWVLENIYCRVRGVSGGPVVLVENKQQLVTLEGGKMQCFMPSFFYSSSCCPSQICKFQQPCTMFPSGRALMPK